MSWFIVSILRPGVPFPSIPFIPSLLLHLLRFLAPSDPLSRRVSPLCNGEGDIFIHASPTAAFPVLSLPISSLSRVVSTILRSLPVILHVLILQGGYASLVAPARLIKVSPFIPSPFLSIPLPSSSRNFV